MQPWYMLLSIHNKEINVYFYAKKKHVWNLQILQYFLIRKKLIIRGDMYTIQCMMLCKIYINYVVYTLLKDKLLALFSTVYRINPIKILQEPIQKGEY